MSQREPQQFFGPSPHHDRACVELRVPLDDRTYRVAPLEPLLLECGFKLRGYLPQEAVPLDAAVRALASEILAAHTHWWSGNGREDGTGWVAIQFPFPRIAGAALQIALRLATAPEVTPQLKGDLQRLAKWMAGISKIRMWLLAAADLCGRDVVNVNLRAEVYQVGQGAKGAHFRRAGSQFDALTGITLEGDKQVTVETLKALGLPTTTGVLVHSSKAAAQAAARLGLPVAVKPLSLNRGTGVAAGLATADEVAAAAQAALTLSRQPVRVERHVDGMAHRLFVAADELLWAFEKKPASVLGDGTATIAELIARENARRAQIRDHSEGYLQPIAMDDALNRHVASRHGLTLADVLPSGTRLDVSAQANTATGGTLSEVTERVHPDNRLLAIRTARLFRLAVMGIDFITPDISRSWKEIPCAIIEVNRMPSLQGFGDAALIHRMLLPNRRSGAIPTLAIIGDQQYRRQAAEAVATAFASTGLRLSIAECPLPKQGTVLPTALPPSIEGLMLDPEADAVAAMLEPDVVERAGLPLTRCDLLLVQDRARFDWFDAADGVLSGELSKAKLERAIGKLARVYGDPAEGGPLPVLEPLDDAPSGTFRLRVWRTRAMPRTWFWDRIGVPAPDESGLTTHEDLLAAVHALAAKAMGGRGKLRNRFDHGELGGAWARPNFDATLKLPAKDPDGARAALLAAVEKVNQVCVEKIG